MKAQRHAAILTLVHRHRIASQEQLRALLLEDGVEVTQATLSRDIRELGLVKVSDPEGGAHYAPPAAADTPPPSLAPLVATLMLSAEGVGPLLVVRTPAGSANALGSALDRHAWPDVVGTIAGDDTLLVIARSPAARRRVAARLAGLTTGG
ncbi:MAG: arginine repressor [Gemmatimonadota bacterium]|nr:arginine repressor [Gemmatimonadota bacterium]MDH4351247.1 arginine repressor [Gemmatimonadota bacterium]